MNGCSIGNPTPTVEKAPDQATPDNGAKHSKNQGPDALACPACSAPLTDDLTTKCPDCGLNLSGS